MYDVGNIGIARVKSWESVSICNADVRVVRTPGYCFALFRNFLRYVVLPVFPGFNGLLESVDAAS